MTDQMNRTPLHYAAKESDIDAMREQIRNGAGVNATDDDGYTPLHFAAQYQHVDAVKLLIENGAEVNSVDSWGNTPLARAVFSSHGIGDTVLALRNAGADPNHSNDAGKTPLELARTIANYDVAQYFNDLP